MPGRAEGRAKQLETDLEAAKAECQKVQATLDRAMVEKAALTDMMVAQKGKLDVRRSQQGGAQRGGGVHL